MKAMESFEHHKKEDISLLHQAIESFNGVAFSFERYYQYLEYRVNELCRALNEKNRVLEASLREKEEVKDHLKSILESLTSGVLVIDLQGMITMFNEVAEGITGFCAETVIGRKFNDVFGRGFFKDAQLRFSSLRKLTHNKTTETEVVRNGEKIYLGLSLSPVIQKNGERVGVVFTMEDITLLKKLEEQAHRNDRLAAMGEMAARMAHEIRNPIGSIELFADILKKKISGQAEAEEYADQISSGVKSVDAIISNLLLFIRPQQKPNFQILDIQDPLSDSLFFSRHMIKENDGIELITDNDPTRLLTRADPELLKQVFLNIILNALQAMPKGGTLRISTHKEHATARNADYAVVRFVDTGNGIAKKDLDKIFDPFFTTKRRGTGLGLSIVHNIVKIHGGSITIESAKKKGTKCTIAFPLCDGR